MLEEIKENWNRLSNRAVIWNRQSISSVNAWKFLSEKISRRIFHVPADTSLSKLLKNPNNMRGKAKPQPCYAPKKKSVNKGKGRYLLQVAVFVNESNPIFSS